ncbi:hypothetical protein GGR50DRAFT_623440 [Xylaria sp. CBS 124048]|nr:hypothetical protein GGR50DRAFT_623440 [Xylaria sp. CBS 124048]
MQSDSSSNSGPLPALLARQWVQDDNGDDVWFWYTTPGIIIKYVIFLVFVFVLAAWIIGGRIHAKRRLRKGLKPLGYHAFLLSRAERAMVDPAYAVPPSSYVNYRPVYGHPDGAGEYYGLHPMPPPVYDPSRPPVYDGPSPGSKADPVQNRQPSATGGAEVYALPAGPPPGASGR